MNILKVLVAGAAIGVLLVAFRDSERGSRQAPARPSPGRAEDPVAEPILGYDGMDVDTLLDWLAGADLERSTLVRMREYEAAKLRREAVLAAIDGRL